MILIVFFQISSHLTSVSTLRCSCFSQSGAQKKYGLYSMLFRAHMDLWVLFGALHLKGYIGKRVYQGES